MAYAAGQLDVAIEAWERAHAACVQAGDQVGAAGAAVRVAMHLLLDTAPMAPVRGWLARAERLLEGKDETSAHAWLAAVRTYERMLTGDLDSVPTWDARWAGPEGAGADPAWPGRCPRRRASAAGCASRRVGSTAWSRVRAPGPRRRCRGLCPIRGALERPLWAPSKELPPTTDLQRAPLLERIEGVPTGRPATQVEDDGLHGQATVGRDLFRRDGDYWSVVFDEPDPRPSVLEPV